MMSENEKIVSRIDSLAKSKGTSIAEIERSVGFGNGKIGKWKKAPKSPPFESLLVVANYLETTIAYLTGETDNPSVDIKKEHPADGEALTDKQKEAIEFIKTLSDNELGWLIAGAKAMQERKNESV